ncbi:CHAP domain-containing protein [Nonomuraea sp. MTCD27]|uniref:CHAP domain-containing protein n=1 Tax=Nonomuraea sp. MTCD27 TaxID=1676747 RepID=UPI0035BF8B4F
MRQELGYKEKSGQFTKFGQWYADRVQDTQYRNAPWCDMFLAYAANKAGISDYVGEFAWTPSHAAWFIKQGAWTQKPEPGALVFFDWRGGKSYKGIDHVGVVERVSGTKIHTIEANVDRVWLKRKTRETDKVVGYGIPRMVKAGSDRLEEIRTTERPFVSPPRAETGHGSPLDVLGTPPALLAAMVLMTIVLSLRVSGRRRGTHRRLPWPWAAPSAAQPPAGTRVPSPRNPLATRDQPPADAKPPARDRAPAREKVPSGGRPPARDSASAGGKTATRDNTSAGGKAAARDSASAGGKTAARDSASAGGKARARDKAPAANRSRGTTAVTDPEETQARGRAAEQPQVEPHPAAAPAQSARPAKDRVPAGSGRSATKHSTPARRKPYDPS